MDANFKNIDSLVVEFIKNIAEKYDIDIKDLENMWKEKSKEIKKSKKAEVETKITGKCEYVFVKGDKKGTICLSKTKDGNLCSKHKSKHSSDAKKKSPKKAGPLQPVVTKNIILRRNKDIGNKLWHPETRLVFKSTRDKIVIGKANDVNEIIPLNDDDIEVCKSMGFAFDKNGSSITTDDDASHKKPKEKVIKPVIKEKVIKETPIKKPDISTALSMVRKNKKSDESDHESILESEDSD